MSAALSTLPRRGGADSAIGSAARRDGAHLAFALAVGAVVLLPVLRPSGPANVGPVDLAVIAGTFATFLWIGATRRKVRFPLAVPIGLFVLGGATGSLTGPVPGTGAIALAQDAMLIVWFWSLVNLVDSSDRLGLIVRTWAYSSVAWAAILVSAVAAGFGEIAGQSAREGARAALTFGNPNFAGNYFCISIMIVWATGRPRRRPFRLGAYALLLVALALTGSNGGILALLVGTTVATILGAYRRGGLPPAVAVCAFALLAGAFLATHLSLDNVQARARGSSYAFIRDGIGRSSKTAADREVLLHQGLDLYTTSGAFGRGPASTKARFEAEGAHRVAEAHTDYLASLNERGAFGFAGVVLLVGGIALRSVYVARSVRSGRLSHAVLNPNALAGAAAALMTAMLSTELLHVRHVWMLLAVLVVAAWQAGDARV